MTHVRARNMQEMQEELENAQEDAGRLMSDLSDSREKVHDLERQVSAHDEQLSSLNTASHLAAQRAEAAEAALSAAQPNSSGVCVYTRMYVCVCVNICM